VGEVEEASEAAVEAATLADQLAHGVD